MIKVKFRQGFSLPELVAVVAILSILATVVILDINPPRRYAESRNATRQSDVAKVSNAISQYRAERSGAMVPGITGVPANVSTLSNSLVPTYLSTIPADPQGGQYLASSDSYNRVVVNAPAAELGITISITQ